MTGDLAEARDVVQEGFVRTWERRAELDLNGAGGRRPVRPEERSQPGRPSDRRSGDVLDACGAGRGRDPVRPAAPAVEGQVGCRRGT
ncbi:hypothetical protein ACFWMJ_20245 [Streptomyces hawaiiensis]|uniref:hypothetical protein n=1 Tax=Streptomyces hawaiiensis TaxID=67305 RepID=UPI0036561C51